MVQRRKGEYGGEIVYRMDRCDLESCAGLYKGQPGLQALLRRAHGGTPPGDGAAELSERVRTHAAAADARASAAVEEAADDLRELDEGPNGNKRSRAAESSRCSRKDGVVPLSMKGGTFDGQAPHGLPGNLPARHVAAGVELRTDTQPRLRRGVRDQVHDGVVRDQRSTTPVLRDLGE